MIQIRVVELVGPICVDPDDGAILCLHVKDALLRGQSVTLDFAGVRALTSSFLNSAVGCLLGSIPADMIRDHLSWSGLDNEDAELVDLVLKNATRFYAATPEAREAIVAASSAAVED